MLKLNTTEKHWASTTAARFEHKLRAVRERSAEKIPNARWTVYTTTKYLRVTAMMPTASAGGQTAFGRGCSGRPTMRPMMTAMPRLPAYGAHARRVLFVLLRSAP